MARGLQLIFLRGLGSNKNIFGSIIGNLDPAYHSLVLEYPPYGCSENGTTFDFNSCADTVQKLLDENNIKPPLVFVGQSLGGLISLKYAVKYPKNVSRLVLTATPLIAPLDRVPFTYRLGVSFGHRSRKFSQFLSYGLSLYSQFLRRFPVKSGISKSIVESREFLQDKNIGSTIHCYYDLFHHDFSEDIKKITCPVLLIYGNQDIPFKKCGAANLYSLFKDKKVLILDCDHRIPTSQAKTVSENIERFLS